MLVFYKKLMYIIIMLKTYKYRIYPTEDQKVLISKTFGCCRKIYNWALDFKNKRYSQYGDNVNRYELDKMLTFLKSTDELKYLNEVHSQSLQQELIHLEKSFTGFFKKKSKYPNFKSKNNRQSYSCPQGVRINSKNQKVFIPKIKYVDLKIDRQFDGKIKTCTVNMSPSQKYFISMLVDDGKELPSKKDINKETSIGLDVGIKTFLTDSNGNEVKNPRFYHNSEPRIKCLGKRLSRKTKGSKNRNKARVRLAIRYEKTLNQRKDFLQKLSTNIIKNHDTIFVEDLDINKMLKNQNLSKLISDVSWFEFFRMLEYKSDWYGKNFIKIGKFDPSSKMCRCGIINKDLTLKDRTWTCKECGSINQRDILAAENVKKFGLLRFKYDTSPGGRGEPVEPLSLDRVMKQEAIQVIV